MFTNEEKEGKMPAASRGNAACQARKKCLYKKGTQAPAGHRHLGWHGAVSAPVHGCQ